LEFGMTVWLLRADGALFVSESFRHAMRTLAVLVIPDEEERAAEKRMDRFPQLGAVGAQGSFYQYVRHLGQTRFRGEFSLEEHQAGGKPGLVTRINRFDLAAGPDPSFEVQSALWKLAEATDPMSIPTVAKKLETDLRDRIIALPKSLPTGEIVIAMAAFEDRFGGISVVPRLGRPHDILDAIPSEAARVFSRAAELAFGKV
jgi:hypothetical protein